MRIKTKTNVSMNLVALLFLPGFAFATSCPTTTIAHRGLSKMHPEESRAAYQAAADLNADYLEMDAHRTKDGVLIVNHDDDFYRTTDIRTVYPKRAHEPISAFTWDEITKLKNRGVPILKLEEVIELALTHKNHPGLYIETKSPGRYPGIEKQLVDLLETKKAFSRLKVFFQSFELSSIRKFKELRPEIPRLYLTEASYRQLLKTEIAIAAKEANGIGPNFDEVGALYLKNFLTRVHEAKLVAHFWTVDSSPTMKTLIDAKTDGIFTNRADLLMKICKGTQ